MKCPYASSGCNYPEGECLGVCCAESMGHPTHSTYPEHTPAFWPIVACLVVLGLLMWRYV